MPDPRRTQEHAAYRGLDLRRQMINNKTAGAAIQRVGACARARLGPRDAVGEPWVGGGLGGRHVPEGGWGR